MLSSNPLVRKLLSRKANCNDVKHVAENIVFNKKLIQELLTLSGFLHSRVVLQRANCSKAISEYLTIETEKTKENLLRQTSQNDVDRKQHVGAIQTMLDVDYFAFNFLRCISNASLTTGANFRDEPQLNLSIQGFGKDALRDLRQELNILPVDNPYPTLLTSGKTPIDFDKPFFYNCDSKKDSQLPQNSAIITTAETAETIGDTLQTFDDKADRKYGLKDNCKF